MACKLRELRDNIYDIIRLRVKAEWFGLSGEVPCNLGFVDVFKNAYMRFYYSEEYAYLFEFAGHNCEVFVKMILELNIDQKWMSFYGIDLLLINYLNRQFDFIYGRFDFKCLCSEFEPTYVCGGDGTCLHYCLDCMCSDIDDPHRDPVPGHNCLITTCPHSCMPHPCNNHIICKRMIPEWVDKMNKGICFHCKWLYGKNEFIDKVDECIVCADEKSVVRIFCGHELCLECWTTIVRGAYSLDHAVTCPMCRRSVLTITV